MTEQEQRIEELEQAILEGNDNNPEHIAQLVDHTVALAAQMAQVDRETPVTMPAYQMHILASLAVATLLRIQIRCTPTRTEHNHGRRTEHDGEY